MTKSGQAAYSWNLIEAQVREAILCQLSILEGLGPSDDRLLEMYLGIDPLLLVSGEGDLQEDGEDVLQSIPLSRHHLHTLARCAYDYAYQLEGYEVMSEDTHYDIVCGALSGFPGTDRHGNPSPLSSFNDEPLRRMFETSAARWTLYHPDYFSGLSVRALALLSNMTMPAVRNSLSKEGFKLETQTYRSEGPLREEDNVATLGREDALLWLSRRRGFVPNRDVVAKPANELVGEIFADPKQTFDGALRRSLIALELDNDTTAQRISAPKLWVEKLIAGATVDIDLNALRSLAKLLTLDEPEFVARAVRHLIELELSRER